MAQTSGESPPHTPTHLLSPVSQKCKALSLFLYSKSESPCPPPIRRKRIKALVLAEWTPVNSPVSSLQSLRHRSPVAKPNSNGSGEFSDWKVYSDEMGLEHPGLVICLFVLSVSNRMIQRFETSHSLS